ncbi:hypothetical protein OG218_15610 [Kineococcus sp. NBC_00420]|uniref:hypothetical protein n=1 Tax=Kineococcus sp. NBC_00420 TaxID=2903564 RepID=UPI002E20CF66
MLRKDEPGHRHFRTPTVLPVLGIVSCVVLLTRQEAGVWLRAGLLLVVGVVLHLVTRRSSRPTTVEV